MRGIYGGIMPLNDDEKRCLAVANQFLLEASAQLGFRGDRVYSPTVTERVGAMLGNIAADEYKSCMRDARDTRAKRSAAR